MHRRPIILLAVVALAGCGGSSKKAPAKAKATATAASKLISTKAGPEGPPLELGKLLTPPPGADGKAHDGIQCNLREQVAYHVHAHLAVFVNGAPRGVPLAIGISQPQGEQTKQGLFATGGKCFYWLHTHASDGIIHIESPSKTTYTLGQFFAVWGQPLSTSQVATAKGPVTAYLNGTKVTGDPAQIELKAHAKIQLDVGTPLVPPQPVDFAGL